VIIVGSRRALFRFGLPAARLVFWFWVLSFDLACLRRANVSWISVLSFDLVRLRRVVFFLARGALFGFGLPTALPSLDRGVLSFDLVLRFVFFLGSRRSRFCLLFLCGSWRVCVCLRPLSRVLLLTAHALFFPCSAVALVSS
jgi:hypothetical protein